MPRTPVTQPLTRPSPVALWGAIERYGYVYLDADDSPTAGLSYLNALGALRPQYGGVLVWDVKPESAMDDVYHSRNTRALVPHTECYEFPEIPPRLVALYCVNPGLGEGGETTLADGLSIVDRLSVVERDLLKLPFRWRSSDGLGRLGITQSAVHPIIEENRGGPVLRFSLNNMLYDGRNDVECLCRKIGCIFEEEKLAIPIARAAMLIWDNHRMLHSRNAFSDKSRHLQRVLIDPAQ